MTRIPRLPVLGHFGHLDCCFGAGSAFARGASPDGVPRRRSLAWRGRWGPRGGRLHPRSGVPQGGATQLCLDLAWPAQGDGPFPGILIFNGGSWMDMGGDRKFCRELLVRLAQRGHVAVAVTTAAPPWPRSPPSSTTPRRPSAGSQSCRQVPDRSGTHRRGGLLLGWPPRLPARQHHAGPRL